MFHGLVGNMMGSFQIHRIPQLLLVLSAFQRLGGNRFPTPLPCRRKLLMVNVQLLLVVSNFFHFLALNLKGSTRDLLAHWAVEINALQIYVRREEQQLIINENADILSRHLSEMFLKTSSKEDCTVCSQSQHVTAICTVRKIFSESPCLQLNL